MELQSSNGKKPLKENASLVVHVSRLSVRLIVSPQKIEAYYGNQLHVEIQKKEKVSY